MSEKDVSVSGERTCQESEGQKTTKTNVRADLQI